jgi:hypothetical protein
LLEFLLANYEQESRNEKGNGFYEKFVNGCAEGTGIAALCGD